MNFPVLTLLALLPAVGAVAVVLAGAKLAKQVALVVAVATAVVGRGGRAAVQPRRWAAVRRAGDLDPTARAPTTPSAWTGSGSPWCCSW